MNYGFFVSGTGGGHFTNTGHISGGLQALHFGDGSDQVIKLGTLSGDVTLGVGPDIFDGKGGMQDAIYGGLGSDVISGGTLGEVIDGGANEDYLRGYGGDDFLFGGDGNDSLLGGVGDDTVYGAAGTDTLNGGVGDDYVYGGTGADVFIFARGNGVDTVQNFAHTTDQIDLRAFDIANLAALTSHALDSAAGLVLDLSAYGGGSITLNGFTLAHLSAQDVLL